MNFHVKVKLKLKKKRTEKLTALKYAVLKIISSL